MRTLLAATVAGALLALCGCAAPGSHQRTITVLLPDSSGLFVGNDVGVLGVPVGRVTALEPAGEVVKATVEITDDRVKLPAHAGAAVVARSVAADRYLEITPVYDGGPTLDDGDVIPLERTATPVDFDAVLASMKKLGDDLTHDPHAANNLRDLLDVSAHTLRGRGAEINKATRSMAAAVSEVASQRGTLLGTVRSLTGLATTLNANEGTVRAFIRNVAQAADLLAAERLDIGAALSSLSRSVEDISRLARTHRLVIRKDVRGLTTVLRNTIHSRRDLEEALDVLPLAGQNLIRTISGDRMRVQMDPAALTPLGPLVAALCPQLAGLCQAIAIPPDLEDLLTALQGGRP